MDGDATEIVGGGQVADLGSPEGQWDDPGIALWSFVLFGCFLLNATLLLAFLIRPGLRTISNRFVMNLTASNLLTCAVLNPLLIVDTVSSAVGGSSMEEERTNTGGSICSLAEGATALIATSSILSVLLIAVDQYFAVVDPLRYRSRIDKLKSGVLIISVWLISSIFAVVASMNPNPRSVWLFCSDRNATLPRNASWYPLNTSANVDAVFDALDSTISQLLENDKVNGNRNGSINEKKNETTVSLASTIAETIASIVKVNEKRAFEESSSYYEDGKITYGLIYAAVHGVFAYLLPFAGVCWIYVSIYFAAHRNSERTRRTGSRPILSSASFCEEQQRCYAASTAKQSEMATLDDFRSRIPKISSLSSIDETSETNTHIGRSSSMADDKNSGVVFTVGSRRIEISPENRESEEDHAPDRVPIATLKAEFLERTEEDRYEDLVRSKFLDRPDQRRKSSHDLMYEEMLARAAARDNEWLGIGGNDSENDVENDEFDTCNVTDERRTTVSPYVSYEIANEIPLGTLSDESISSSNEREIDRDAKSNHRRYSDDSKEIANGGIVSVDTSTHFRRYSECESSRDDSKDTAKDSISTEPSTCLLAPIVTITPAAPNRASTASSLHRVSSVRSTSSYIVSLRHRISNGSLFRYREETRAARIGALVIVMGLICWSPYVLLLLLKNVPSYRYRDLPREYDISALSLIVLAAYLSPLLFGYRSRRVKRELRKFFCFRRELSYKNNRSLMAKKVLKRRHSGGTLGHVEMDHRYNIFNCVYGRSRWPKDKVQFVQVPDTALVVETCRSSFSSGASTQISSTSTEEC